MRGEFNRTHLVTTLELAVALLTTLLAASLLAALTTLLSTLAALLTWSAAGLLSITLTARSLLPALLTATLIFSTIVCHNTSSRVRNVYCLIVVSRETDTDLKFAAFIQNRLQRLS
jgi:hypothetical protein